MITYGSDLMTKANADMFAADHNVEVKEISLEQDLYEIQILDIQGVGQSDYADMLVFAETLPELELIVEEEETEDE